jgi:hypothetical protein
MLFFRRPGSVALSVQSSQVKSSQLLLSMIVAVGREVSVLVFTPSTFLQFCPQIDTLLTAHVPKLKGIVQRGRRLC